MAVTLTLTYADGQPSIRLYSPRYNRLFTRQANPRLQGNHHGDIPACDQNLSAGIKSILEHFARGCTHLQALLQL